MYEPPSSTDLQTYTSSSYGLPTPPESRPSSANGKAPPFDPQKFAEALCQQAREISEELNVSSPFMEKAIEEGIDFVGGKKDGQSMS